MDRFFDLSPADRRIAFTEAEARLGLRAISIEKDFWVCWTLRALFELPEWGDHLTFKGGTSLSKAWHIIKRFSEDIDLVIDRDYLGCSGDLAPERATSKKQRTKRLEELKEASRTHIRDKLLPALHERFAVTLPADLQWRLKADPEDKDEQTLLFSYPNTLLAADNYIKPWVKIELGARSDTEPVESVEIGPYLAEAFPDLFPSSRFPVRVVAARRTFWEKAMLLHEELHRPGSNPPRASLSRHYYDLWRLITEGIADQAVADEGLFDRIVEHRKVFFRQNWMTDYSTLARGSLRLLPDNAKLGDWKADYANMEEMFFGEAPDFDEILRLVGEFQDRFNGAEASKS